MNAARMAAVAALLAAPVAGCDPVAQCPTSVDEATAVEYDDEVVGGGYVIRYIPSIEDARFRGYEINLTRPASERAQLDTYLLRVDAPIPGIVDGQPVLLLGERTDRTFALVPGACPALVGTTEEDVRFQLDDR